LRRARIGNHNGRWSLGRCCGAGAEETRVKTYVVDRKDNSRSPFLRGILIHTLLEAGMPFERAYELATTVRDQLSETEEISGARLRQMVGGLLVAAGELAVAQQYRLPAAAPARIMIRGSSGTESAFSRRKYQRYLQSSGVRLDEAERITTKVFEQLFAAGTIRLTTLQLGYLTYVCLQQELGTAVAQQYLVWMEFQRSGRPLILLIGGAVGSGKSSIATEVAHRLEIVRTQSTDMLREVMRTMIPKKLLPILHCSSFDAWKTLPVQEKEQRDRDMLLAEGYRGQVDLLAVSCEAVMRRAVKESVSLILEGVHCHPNLLHCLPRGQDAILVHVTLAVLDDGDLKARLRGRASEVPQRRARRYLKKFDSIWRLQSFLVAEAERCDTPVIPNDDRETAIFQVIGTLNAELSRHFVGSPAALFGSSMGTVMRKARGKPWQQLVAMLGLRGNAHG
jgi:2-phosphoglycerate kinase